MKGRRVTLDLLVHDDLTDSHLAGTVAIALLHYKELLEESMGVEAPSTVEVYGVAQIEVSDSEFFTSKV